MNQKNDILFEERGAAGIVTLNKPETLNAVTDSMLSALNAQLDVWEDHSSIDRIIIKAAPGRAFSAGGDIRHLYERGMAKDYDFEFFAREYALNARIAKFPKPYIALVDGIAMGGGVGVSFHGSHRVATENISFAMPEVGIGFFPDVGASHFLSRLPGQLGLYLGMTGARVKQADALWSGLATHACLSKDLAELELALSEGGDVDATLKQFSAHPADGDLKQKSRQIDTGFSGTSVTEILNNLENADQYDEWAVKTRNTMVEKSPTSLQISYQQINAGKSLDIDACMKMEYRILRRILKGPDFYEGIRAVIIDKDNAPVWSPSTLDKIDPHIIDGYFESLGNEELNLP